MKFFFDVRDGSEEAHDETGVELADSAAAKLQATIALTEMARDSLPDDGDERQLTIHVRTSDGPQFYVSLDYEVHDADGAAVEQDD